MDINYLLWLQELREQMGGALDGIFGFFSQIAISPLVFIVMAVIYWCISEKAGSLFFLNVGFANAATCGLKLTACVYRPWIRDSRILPVGGATTTATSYSFPSGHGTLITAQFGTLAVWQKKRKWLVGICVAVIALVMFSRNYLGVHTPQDVLVGCALSCAVIFLTGKLWKWMENGKNRDWILTAVVFAVGILALVYYMVKPYPMDYNTAGNLIVDPLAMQPDGFSSVGQLCGTVLGMTLARHFVRFDVSGSVPVRILRGVIGALGMLGINELKGALKSLLGDRFGGFGFGILLFLFVMFLYPLIFTNVEKKLEQIKSNKEAGKLHKL